MNQEQALSFVRWFAATVGPFLISHGYISSGSLEMVTGVIVSLVPLVWSMFVHTQANAIAVVDTMAKSSDSPVKAIVMEPTAAGKAIADSLPGNTTVVAGSAAAANKAA